MNDEWGVVFSSGSTGSPKPVIYSEYAIVTECVAWCIELGMRRGEAMYLARPMYYTGGMALAFSTLMTRGLLVLDSFADENDAREIQASMAAVAQSRHLDRCFLVPELVRGMISEGNHWATPGNPAMCLVMGSKFHVDEKRGLQALLGSAIVESWGNSEGLGTITDPEDLDARPESIGRPFLTERLWIMDEQLQPCAAGEIGRIVGSDETMFQEYANRPADTEATKKESKVLSGDMGRRDQDGFFYIVGRMDEVVTTGDVVIAAPALEEVIRKLPGIRDASVAIEAVGPREFRFLVLLATERIGSREEWQRLLNRALGKLSKRVKKDVVVKIVDAIPRLSSGKTDRTRARELVLREKV